MQYIYRPVTPTTVALLSIIIAITLALSYVLSSLILLVLFSIGLYISAIFYEGMTIFYEKLQTRYCYNMHGCRSCWLILFTFVYLSLLLWVGLCAGVAVFCVTTLAMVYMFIAIGIISLAHSFYSIKWSDRSIFMKWNLFCYVYLLMLSFAASLPLFVSEFTGTWVYYSQMVTAVFVACLVFYLFWVVRLCQAGRKLEEQGVGVEMTDSTGNMKFDLYKLSSGLLSFV